MNNLKCPRIWPPKNNAPERETDWVILMQREILHLRRVMINDLRGQQKTDV